MSFTEHPRLLARIAGALYLIITACALFAYLYVRNKVIVADDMAQTAANFLAHEQLYRSGFALIGLLIFRSRFLPAIPGLLMIVAGVTYWINSFRLFLALPIPYVQWVTLIAELSLALWLLVVGVNEAQWRAQAHALQNGSSAALARSATRAIL